jgi:speckle-type POZ protein
MFSAKMSESKENVVTINDIDFPVMKELIRYIYTDHVENMKEFAAPLLVAADKVTNYIHLQIRLLSSY